MRPGSALPRVVIRAVAWLLPADVREAAGDLFEQYRDERRSMLWLVAQGVGLVCGLQFGASRHLGGERRMGGFMTGLWLDVRIAARVLTSHRRFSAVAIGLLALGIGATTAIFSVVNAVLLRPLPYANPDRLVAVTTAFRAPSGDRIRPVVALSDLADWRPRARSLESIGGFAYTQLPVRVGSLSHSAVTALMDAQFLPMLGRPLQSGTFFDAAGGDDRSVIVSHAFWRDVFGADPVAVGRTIEVDGEPYVVRGVLAADFQFPRSDASYFTKPVALMMPSWTFPGFPATARQWFGIARLKDGVTLAEAQAELASIAEGLSTPDAAGVITSVRLAPLADETTKRSREALVISLAISIVLLLIASTNLMNLFFARASSRIGEMAIRRAIGCSTARLVRQMLVEGLLLAAAGGLAGVLLASLVLARLVALSPVHLPITGGLDIDARVLAFTALVCGGAALLACLFPALHASGGSSAAVRTAGVRASQGRGVTRVQQVLCVAQIALGVALLASAALLARSFWQLHSLDPGFDFRQVVGFDMAVPNSVPRDERVRLYARVLEEVRTVPGVEGAGLISFLPPETRAGVFMGLAIDGIPADPAAPPRVVNTLISSPGYFATMRMPIVRGRDFTPRDTGTGPPVIVVNEALVRRYFGDRDPVGSRIGTGFDRLAPVREVIGVVRDARDRGSAADPVPTAYIPFEQFSLPYAAIAARTASDPDVILPVIRARVSALAAVAPLTEFQTLEARMAQSMREPRFYMLMAGVCAGLAVLFVAFGLYGLISYSVSRRVREIGIRMALGAQRASILGLVLGQGLTLSAAGIAIGLGLAVLSTSVLESLLFRVEPLDPLALSGAAALVVVLTVAASIAPARRASGIDPVVALKAE